MRFTFPISNSLVYNKALDKMVHIFLAVIYYLVFLVYDSEIPHFLNCQDINSVLVNNAQYVSHCSPSVKCMNILCYWSHIHIWTKASEKIPSNFYFWDYVFNYFIHKFVQHACKPYIGALLKLPAKL